MDQHEALMRDAPLLTRLGREDLRALADRGQTVSFRRGQTIFHQDDLGDALYLVIEGSVHISVVSAEGQEATLAMLGPGESFGDLALLDGRPRSASAIAAQSTKAFVVTRDEFLAWLKQHPLAAFTLLETLSLRLRQKDEALSDLAFLELPYRLAKRLVDLVAMDPAARKSDGGAIGVKVTQNELAAALTVTRQSVNKELKEFEDRGWVKVSRGGITVNNAPALRAFWRGE